MADTFQEYELADKSRCAGLRADLKMCLLQTDCCKKERLTPRKCLEENKAPQCMDILHSFVQCKKSIIDNRSRFRGTKGY